MKLLIGTWVVLTWTFVSDAQITATVEHLPDGSSQVIVRNDSPQPLTALALAANLAVRDTNYKLVGTRDPIRLYQDTALDAEPGLLLPGQRRSFPPFAFYCEPTSEGSGEPGRRPVQAIRIERQTKGPVCELEQLAVAGVNADGSTTGDQGLLVRLMLRRSNLLLAIDTTIDVLQDAGSRNVPRDQLLKQFSLLAGSLNRWYVPAEQQTGRSVYQSMVTKLANLPEGPLGSSFPPSEFVTRETTGLNQQRTALLEAQPSLADPTLLSDPAHQHRAKSPVRN